MPHDPVFLLVVTMVTRLAWLVISWYAESAQERARARTLAALARAVEPGTTLVEKSANGRMMIVTADGRYRPAPPTSLTQTSIDGKEQDEPAGL
jgi:hypothetical protein